jgi:hypothetical protein
LSPVKPLPKRILLDNTAGKVVFEHQKHIAGYGIDCQSCHHDRSRPTPTSASCRSCHGAADKPGFRETHQTRQDDAACVTCHHAEFAGAQWNHDAHRQIAEQNCAVCHHGDARSQPQPENCATCHLASDGDAPPLSAAVHARCAVEGCHADLFPKEGSTAQLMASCATCHNLVETRTTLRDKGWAPINPAYADCAVCHAGQATEDLIPGPMQAFHNSCVSCHEKLNKGPYGQEACNQCHTK